MSATMKTKSHATTWPSLALERHIVRGTNGEIAFTARGQQEFGPLLARYNLRLCDITTVQEFEEAMRSVNQLEIERTQRELIQSLEDPEVHEDDKSFIRGMLGVTQAPLPARTRAPRKQAPLAQVISLAEWKQRHSS